MTSILYFSWADIGTMGEPSAIVPGKKKISISKLKTKTRNKLEKGFVTQIFKHSPIH